MAMNGLAGVPGRGQPVHHAVRDVAAADGLAALFEAAGTRIAGRTAAAMSHLRRAGASFSSPSPAHQAEDDVARICQVVGLYRLVLETTPDRPGLLHHADLLAAGHSLSDLAASLLSVAGLGSAPEAVETVAAGLWKRANPTMRGFTASWAESRTLPRFAATLVRDTPVGGAVLLGLLFPDGVDPALDDVYPAWAYRLWSAENERVLCSRARRVMPLLRLAGPRIALALEVAPDMLEADLDATLASLATQIYGRWRLVVRGTAPSGFAWPDDPRIGKAAGDQGGLRGTIAAGDTLSPACLALHAFASLRRPDVAAWSSDQDRRGHDGICHRPGLDPIRAGGLVLARSDAASGTRMAHLPAVLLHRRDAMPAPGKPSGSAGGTLPRISIVIATRDRAALLRRCLDSLRRTTMAASPEIVLVDNGSIEPDARALLESLRAEGCLVLHRPGAFNWSRLNNDGVRAASGDVVVLLNNDIECIAPGWLERLVAPCLDSKVGVAGAELLHADGSVQHAGVLVGPGPVAAHRWSDGLETGTRPVTAVTGACMAIRRDVFERLGGLDETLPVTWNDLDFCLRARKAGLDVRLVSDSVLRHEALGTRTPDSAPENRAQLAAARSAIARRHRQALKRDGFAHPLTLLESGGRLLDPRASRRIWALVRSGGVARGVY